METFALRSLTFTYPGGRTPAIRELSLTVRAGEFWVLCGPSGCGKTTLLRQLKPLLSPAGQQTGEILFQGTPLRALDRRTQCGAIGFVGQSPDSQIVTDKVWHELAFGPESLGLEPAVIRRRVAEMAAFFGIQSWFHRDTDRLSGGQKQLVNLAAAMVLQPSVLLLDEPTGQLDPIAASEFLTLLRRINRELGTTILLSEHRLEEALPLADRAAVLDRGRLLCQGTPAQAAAALLEQGHPMLQAMPAPLRIWAAADGTGPAPLTVRAGRSWLSDFAREHPLRPLPPELPHPPAEPTVLEARGLRFRYDRAGEEVLRGLDLTLGRGELLALLGGNGAGKTTALRLLAGIDAPDGGSIRRQGRTALLPQSPKALFTRKTLGEELEEGAPSPVRAAEMARLCGVEQLLHRHPYDLSGGEQQRAALAKVLLTEPDILLLDEPTKGLDAACKRTLADLLTQLTDRGAAILIVSHDVEFCAQYAHRCALLFDGAVAAQGPARAFFAGNSFYTTAANRMARHLLPQAVTAEDVIAACGGPPPPAGPSHPPGRPDVPDAPEVSASPPVDAPAAAKRPTSRRAAAGAAISLLCVPLTLLAGLRRGSGYVPLSLAILAECMLPFFLVYEGRRPQARELAVLASLSAIAVAGRAAFFMLPQCKPVMALTILTGVSLGGEAGFLVGAVTMLVSNLLFGQGPWTPWQMFAMGLTGFFAGLLAGPLRRRWALCTFSALAAVALYGGIMNLSTALLAAPQLTWPVWLAYEASGFPMDCVQAAATALFLWIGSGPILEKLERVKRKYSLSD